MLPAFAEGMLRLGSLGLIVVFGSMLAVREAGAVPITGEVYFGGFSNVELIGDGTYAGAIGLDFANDMDAFVGFNSTGDFAVPAPVDPDNAGLDELTWATFHDFTFAGLPSDVWHIDAMGFTFKLTTVNVDPHSNGLILSGSGEVRSSDPNKETTSGSFYFSLQDDPDSSSFIFSADNSFSVPEGGASVVLLGLGLVGLASFRRILAK